MSISLMVSEGVIASYHFKVDRHAILSMRSMDLFLTKVQICGLGKQIFLTSNPRRRRWAFHRQVVPFRCFSLRTKKPPSGGFLLYKSH